MERADHQPVFGVGGHVVPAVAAGVVGWVGAVAVLLLRGHERPLLIELDLARLGRKKEVIVELLGVSAGPQAVADHRVLVHAEQAVGLAHADPLGDMAQDGHHLRLR
jgi:hypothetical protein